MICLCKIFLARQRPGLDGALFDSSLAESLWRMGLDDVRLQRLEARGECCHFSPTEDSRSSRVPLVAQPGISRRSCLLPGQSRYPHRDHLPSKSRTRSCTSVRVLLEGLFSSSWGGRPAGHGLHTKCARPPRRHHLPSMNLVPLVRLASSSMCCVGQPCWRVAASERQRKGFGTQHKKELANLTKGTKIHRGNRVFVRRTCTLSWWRPCRAGLAKNLKKASSNTPD